MEIWKNIEGYENYQISNYGRVKSLWYNREKILKSEIIRGGYLRVCLCQDGKKTMKLVHRLVAEAFLENPQNLPEVNHKDECKTNNQVSNLEWCDRKYNNNYGKKKQKIGEYTRKRCSKRVDQIDAVSGEVVRQWESTNEAGRNGYSQSHVSACARGLQKTYKGYIWKYAPM